MFLLELNILLFYLSMVIIYILSSHALMMMLSLEFLTISIIHFLMILSAFKCVEFFVLFFLVLSVMESVLGLTLILIMMRQIGEESLSSLNLK